ncbi:MAG: hypothetical protein NT003_05320 [Candidatus Magasanikbacteria bacterium]|nr:hypothetical protein [Candidatus Magasanikbacteria bacterium]
MQTHNKIVSAFLNGTIQGIEEIGLIPEHTETQISHLFLYPKTVYKICKRDNHFFNEHFRNLADHQTRFDFYKSDFFENNYFSPEVYIALQSIVINDEKISVSNFADDTDDVVIKMNRIDLANNLSELLHDNVLQETDFRSMGYQQTKAVAAYPHQPKTAENYFDIFGRRLNDLKDWMHSASTYISNEHVDEFISKLRNYLEKHKDYFSGFDAAQYVVSLDNHSDNIFYQTGKMFFLDIYPPKEDWMTVVPWINMYRPATDILILSGEKNAEAFMQGCVDFYGELDRSHDLFYFVYSAAIQAVSLFNLSKDNKIKFSDAELYRDFILNSVRKLG